MGGLVDDFLLQLTIGSKAEYEMAILGKNLQKFELIKIFVVVRL